MAGYNHFAGMSNNAVAAYDAGLKPLSKITKADLVEVGLHIPLAFARWLAKQGEWRPDEWHHSGGTWYNRVDFYDPAELARDIEGGFLDLDALRKQYESDKKKKKKDDDGVRVEGTYTVWGGTRRRPRKVGFTGVKLGNWIYLDGGGKKKADGNHIQWKELKRCSLISA